MTMVTDPSECEGCGLLQRVRLVRTNTVFWNASGISANLGLTGLHIHTESLASILAGGIAFATPNEPGARVKSGSVFRLEPEVKDKWLKWSPIISLGSGTKSSTTAARASDDSDAGEDQAEEGEAHHHKGGEAGDSGSKNWFRDLFHKR